MANTYFYGFRMYRTPGDTSSPPVEEMTVATTYQAQDDGAGFSVDLNIGDPVDLVALGTVGLANGGETPYGIIVGIRQYWDGSVIVPAATSLPGGTAWGTILQRSSIVLVTPVSACDWRICVDDATTATTETAYRNLRGKNAVHTCVGVSATAEAVPRLDITTATTATHEWRIVGVPTGQDYASANVEVVVRANFSSEPGWPATPSVGV